MSKSILTEVGLIIFNNILVVCSLLNIIIASKYSTFAELILYILQGVLSICLLIISILSLSVNGSLTDQIFYIHIYFLCSVSVVQPLHEVCVNTASIVILKNI